MNDIALNIILAIVGAVTAGGVTWFNLRRTLSAALEDLATAKTASANAAAEVKQLQDKLNDAGDQSSILTAKRSEAVGILKDVIFEAQAVRASLYVPAHTNEGRFLGLVVLATAPLDASDDSFLGSVFSGRDSKAVEAYLSKETVRADGSAYQIEKFEVTGSHTEPLQASAADGSGALMGVVQLLSDGAAIPEKAAKDALKKYREPLISIAENFQGQNEGNIELAGLNVPREASRGTVLSFDISNSSSLFLDEARSLVTRSLMREIMSASLSEIQSRSGTFESFTGDGFIAAFHGGARDARNTSALRALECALAVHAEAYRVIGRYAADLDRIGARLGFRFGLSTGIIHPFNLTSGQLRSGSVLGRTVSLAKKVGDAAPRDDAQLWIDASTYQELGERERAQFEPASPVKLAAHSIVAYKIKETSLKLHGS